MSVDSLISYAFEHRSVAIVVYALVHLVVFNALFSLWKSSLSVADRVCISNLKIASVYLSIFFIWTPVAVLFGGIALASLLSP